MESDLLILKIMKKKSFSFFFLPLFLVIFGMFHYKNISASTSEGSIDRVYKYAWSEKYGWINFGCDNCNVRITDTSITGYAWSENFGWINLNPPSAGVKNDGKGNLSGYAWSENLGWINFEGVTINNNTGEFFGYATVVKDGSKISFNCQNTNTCENSDFKVKTDWRPFSSGGGMPYQWFHAPTPPPGGFKVLINEGVKYTYSPLVTLTLFGGPDTTRMAISNNPQFFGKGSTGQIPYQSTYQWNLCQGKTKCTEGKYTVYVKFYTPWGKSSKIISSSIIYKKPKPSKKHLISETILKEISQKLAQIAEKIIVLKKQIQQIQQQISKPFLSTSSPPFCPYFIKSLKFGDIDPEVKKVQQFLKEQGFFPSSHPLTNYFGPLTLEAVKKFQRKYSQEILKPWNLTQPTGVWHITTKKHANKLIGCEE